MANQQNKPTLRVANIIIELLLVFVFSACGGKNTTVPTATVDAETVETQPASAPTATLELLPTATTANTPEPTATEPLTETTQLDDYAFVVLLDYNNHILDVEESIQYINRTGQDLTQIQLVVPPNQKEGEFELTKFEFSDPSMLADYALEGITLTSNLASPLAAGSSLNLSLHYRLTLPFNGGVRGYTDLQTNLSDWYPFVAPYEVERGWVINQPAEVGEYLVYDSANFDMTLALTGPQGMVLAASTEAAPIDVNIYKLVQNNSRGITFSVSDQYQVVSQTYGNIVVNGYAFPGDEGSAQVAVQNTGSALLLFSNLFGVPYPHASISVVESDFPDGMEYDGLYYLSKTYYRNYDGSFQNYLSLLSVHETAHQWWFGVVGNDQAREPWLDESLATYSEYLFIEQYYPGLTDWWLDYRIADYRPTGKVNKTIYDEKELRPYINTVYLQGASFLHELRGALGDEAFFTGLKKYVETCKYQNASWDDFIEIMIPTQTDATNELIVKYFN